MEMILWRHADAEDLGLKGDGARNLTRKGHKQAERMARWLNAHLQGDWTVLSSPATRAVQTVAALERPYEVRDELDTGRSADALLRLAGWPKGGRIVVVGHNPTLGEAAATLLGGEQAEVRFRKGAIWWFMARERGGRIDTTLKAVLDPDLLDEAEAR